ncbi:MAG: helix-turn-helix domain-containing protein [Methanomicrobiaceae archaeon]|nr:helix-turn-helix domain-containing protein [Methanomicrobiaceae archaeon]
MNKKSYMQRENDEINIFLEPENSEIITTILELIRNEPRGLTITDIALHLKINRNTVRKYTMMLTAGGYIEERTCGHTKVFNISNRMPLTSILDYLMEGILILDEKKEILYSNYFLNNNLNFETKDLIKFLKQSQVKDAIDKTAITGFAEKYIETDNSHKETKKLRVRFRSANSFSGKKMTIIYIAGDEKQE